MFRYFIPAVAAVTLTVGAAFSPASAAPASVSGLTLPDSGVQHVQMTRREMRHRRMMRNRHMMRRSMRRSSGNARNPSRRPMMQNQGNTTGGYR